ncbi:MAG TPA: hypothetical protein VF244_07715 [Acidimicrobiales bacterium]
MFDHSQATGNERLVLLAIAHLADGDGVTPGDAWESGQLARMTRLNDHCLERAIHGLIDGSRLLAIGSGDRVESLVVVRGEGGR